MITAFETLQTKYSCLDPDVSLALRTRELHKMHNTKLNALNEMQKSNPKLYQKKNKAVLSIWKMHAFKLNIKVDIIVQIYRKMLMLE